MLQAAGAALTAAAASLSSKKKRERESRVIICEGVKRSSKLPDLEKLIAITKEVSC